MALRDWKMIEDELRYKVWILKRNPNYSLVAKTEDGIWVLFTHMITGTSIKSSGKTKSQTLASAKSYMEKN